ncbi:hypothetical protein [Roseofilum capinflatum]|uniref:Uncharacterized protein n=1 Tax=Roseofilum capinflatum BLCC-M114 TaxID=3022440 RepID=A0ABT7B6M1_9CYAN|nr:hypothetical protein [Roseofilum capinflatum]MDJ1174274.1 hypothetical protein [Roseofilum capinflatum BLCC-M114]
MSKIRLYLDEDALQDSQVNTHNPETRFLQETGFLIPLERSPSKWVRWALPTLLLLLMGWRN